MLLKVSGCLARPCVEEAAAVGLAAARAPHVKATGCADSVQGLACGEAACTQGACTGIACCWRHKALMYRTMAGLIGSFARQHT